MSRLLEKAFSGVDPQKKIPRFSQPRDLVWPCFERYLMDQHRIGCTKGCDVHVPERDTAAIMEGGNRIRSSCSYARIWMSKHRIRIDLCERYACCDLEDKLISLTCIKVS